MTATEVNGRAVLAVEPAVSKWIDADTGQRRLYKSVVRLLLDDGTEVYGCTRCDYTAERSGSVGAHQRVHGPGHPVFARQAPGGGRRTPPRRRNPGRPVHPRAAHRRRPPARGHRRGSALPHPRTDRRGTPAMTTPTTPPTRRRVVVVDTETDGLDPELHRPVEVGYLTWPHDTEARGLFVPPHRLDHAAPSALAINRYHERIANRPRDYTYRHTAELHATLRGATLAGANPRFDAGMLRHLFTEAGLSPVEPWHYRLLDIEAYCGALLGFAPYSLPSLSTLCEVTGIAPGEHSAWSDACAAWQVLSAIAPEPAHADAAVALAEARAEVVVAATRWETGDPDAEAALHEATRRAIDTRAAMLPARAASWES